MFPACFDGSMVAIGRKALERTAMGIASIVLAVAMGGAGPATGVGDMPSTPTGFYEAGQTFANCSAHFAFAAEVSRDLGIQDTATALEDKERGWHLAGLVLLFLGLTEDRQSDAEQLLGDMEAAQVSQFRAWREVEPRGYSQRMTDLFQDKCEPWVDLQERLISAMRRAEPS
jgi:hypothetical protein